MLFLLSLLKWGCALWEQPEEPSSAADAWQHLRPLPMAGVKFSVAATTMWTIIVPSPKVVDRNHGGMGCSEQKICDIVRGKWAQGMRDTAEGLAPLQGQETPLTVSGQCAVDLNKFFFFLILEIIHPDLCLVAENAISLFPDGTNYLPFKIHLKITWPISMFQFQLIF